MSFLNKKLPGIIASHFGAFSFPLSNGWVADIVFSVVGLVGYDLGVYLIHYGMHNLPFLWEFHKIHHCPKSLTPLSKAFVHPLDGLITGVCGSSAMVISQVIVSYFFKVPPSKIAVFGIALMPVYLNYLKVLDHSDVWWSWGKLQHVLLCPAQHILHHSSDPKHYNCNLATTFSFFDKIFGTFYYAPKSPDGEIKLGVEDGFDWDNVSPWQIFARPFKESFLCLIRRRKLSIDSVSQRRPKSTKSA